MSEGTVDKDLVIAGLIESNDILQTEITTLRSSNRLLRKVNSILRGLGRKSEKSDWHRDGERRTIQATLQRRVR